MLIRSPKWLRKYFDFEFAFGKDLYPAARERRKILEESIIRTEESKRKKIAPWDNAWKSLLNDKSSFDYFERFLRSKNLMSTREEFWDAVKRTKTKCEIVNEYELLNDFARWMVSVKAEERRIEQERIERERIAYAENQRRIKERQERQREQEAEKLRKARERQNLENQLEWLLSRIKYDWYISPYGDKITSSSGPGSGGRASYTFEDNKKVKFEDDGQEMKVTFTGSDGVPYGVTISGIDSIRSKFIFFLNECIRNQRDRPRYNKSSQSNSSNSRSSQSNSSNSRSSQSYSYTETEKTGDPARDRYNTLNDKIKLREEQIRLLKPNDPDRVSLQNELNNYKRVRDKIKRENSF